METNSFHAEGEYHHYTEARKPCAAPGIPTQRMLGVIFLSGARERLVPRLHFLWWSLCVLPLCQYQEKLHATNKVK